MLGTREIPLFTLSGVPDADVTTHYITTGDKLGLSMLRFQRQPSEDAVLILHGLTTSSDMYIMPEHMNLVRYLLDHGYEVWCLDYRMSNRHPYNMLSHRFTMDDIALYDYPPAIAEMKRHVGDKRIHVIAHCLGAVSFAMSLFGGATTGVSSVILNSAALTPRVPAWSGIKLRVAPLVLEYLMGLNYISPDWADEPRFTMRRIIAKIVGLFHRECKESACHMLSLMWGSGNPALYSHDLLAEITHRRSGDLYGATSVHYFRHVRKMVRAGNRAVKYDPRDQRHAALPDDYFERVGDVHTPVLFVTGKENKVFTDSNILCHQRMEAIVPGRHQLHVFPKYGHQDVFMGEHVARDVFPKFLEFLEQQRRLQPRPARELHAN